MADNNNDNNDGNNGNQDLSDQLKSINDLFSPRWVKHWLTSVKSAFRSCGYSHFLESELDVNHSDNTKL
ncbi:hypothetical protein DERF_006060 [Dermatophagoides farinae]|uniref:Uncharacterized protein n=1 Tax=Dermatophagoides farinae TaxID=6954 RepID=A0A922I9L2_DERFA|nr:hypothetical protein DERF_006060 [Dermatophagoides farinae]